MVQIFTLLILTVMDALLITGLFMVGMPNGAIAASVIGTIIFAIWSCIIGFTAAEEIKSQAEDLRDYENQEAKLAARIEECEKDKEAYEANLTKYKDEVQNTLLETYKQFEESIMEKIKDSKLIAMAMKKSGYADLLAGYHSNIIELTNKIKGCDTSINCARKDCEVNKLNYAKKMLVRQSQGVFGIHYIYPKHLIFKKTNNK
jgi:hypothetical protein